MQSNTLQSSPSTINDPALSTRIMRLGGAPNALGFAQVMQAFETGIESSLAQTIADSQDDQVATDQDQPTDSDAVSEADADQDATDSIDDATNQNPAVGGINSQDTNSGDVVVDSTAGVGEGRLVNSEPSVPVSQAINENTQENEASLRLLKNQSEQAKLSIKGLVRSLTQGAGTDATALAVQTMLGQAEPSISSASVDNQSQAQPQARDSTPVQAQPIPESDSVSRDVPSPVQTSRVEQPGSGAMSPPGLVIDPSSAQPVDARSSGSDIGVSQSRTQRVDVGSLASQIQPTNPSGDVDRASATQRAAQLAGITQSSSSAAIKSISSIDAGNIGSQPRDPNPGSLVERMKSSAASSETNRAGVMAQVQRGLASLLRSGSSEMTLKLTPVHLGEVRIHIKPGKSGLGIRFETTSNEATELLESSVKELSAALRTKGIALDQIRVEHAPHDSQTANPTESSSESNQADSPFANTQSDQAFDQGDHAQPDQSNQHARGSRGDVDTQINPTSDIADQQPAEIWTELGLDAIA